MHDQLLGERLLARKYCREDTVCGKVMQGHLCGFKELRDVIATSPTFVFGKVPSHKPIWAAPEKETGPIEASLSSPGRGGGNGTGGTQIRPPSGARCDHHYDDVSPWPAHGGTGGVALAASRSQSRLSRCPPSQTWSWRQASAPRPA